MLEHARECVHLRAFVSACNGALVRASLACVRWCWPVRARCHLTANPSRVFHHSQTLHRRTPRSCDPRPSTQRTHARTHARAPRSQNRQTSARQQAPMIRLWPADATVMAERGGRGRSARCGDGIICPRFLGWGGDGGVRGARGPAQGIRRRLGRARAANSSAVSPPPPCPLPPQLPAPFLQPRGRGARGHAEGSCGAVLRSPSR